MARTLFGTDGIRGEANVYPMTADVAMRLGRALAWLVKNGKLGHKQHAAMTAATSTLLPTSTAASHRRVVIGKDTRVSGYLIEQAIAAYNTTAHIHSGLAVGKVHVLPPLTVREAIVNGLAHRDWGTDTPTTIEHVGTTLAVTSPGGFIGGVTPENIITHPSAPRHRALAMLLAKLRIAEHEGVGVDRMVRDMLRVGYPRPVIEEIGGPMVRAVLIGGASRTHRFGAATARRLAEQLATLSRLEGAGLAVTLSRRTPPEAGGILRQALDRLPSYVWNGEGENPYFGLLGTADAVVVTSDSVSMTSEACATGKPVYVAAVEGGSKKFAEFHAVLAAEGYARIFAGRLDAEGGKRLTESVRIAAEIRRRMAPAPPQTS